MGRLFKHSDKKTFQNTIKNHSGGDYSGKRHLSFKT